MPIENKRFQKKCLSISLTEAVTLYIIIERSVICKLHIKNNKTYPLLSIKARREETNREP